MDIGSVSKQLPAFNQCRQLTRAIFIYFILFFALSSSLHTCVRVWDIFLAFFLVSVDNLVLLKQLVLTTRMNILLRVISEWKNLNNILIKNIVRVLCNLANATDMAKISAELTIL